MTSCFRALITTLILFGLTACGGGGTLQREDGGGGSTPVADVLSISVDVTSTSGEQSNIVSADSPLLVTATVTDQDGNGVAGEDVTFTLTDPALAVFTNGVSIVRTDASGVATVTLTVGDTAGAGFVEASVATDVVDQVGFNSTGQQTTAVEPASLELFASAIQLSSSGSDQIELIAVVKNEQNVLLEGVSVAFAVDSGELQVTQAQTAADGTARAILTSANNKENRTITATVSAGEFSESLQIQVVGTSLNINGPASVVLNDEAEYTVLLADSDGVGIANQSVAIASANGNTLSTQTVVTDETGQANFTMTADNSGVDTLSATALNVSTEFTVEVQQDQFSFTALPSADIELGTNSDLTVTWLQDGAPVVGADIAFTLTRGSIVAFDATTDSSGQATVTVSSNNAGTAVVSAQGVDGSSNVVNARADIEFVATLVDTIILSASPNSIGPDGQKSTITAVLRDPQGNLVKGKTVTFNADDVSGGSISPATSVTDSNGIASTVYTSNAVTSEGGITITATEADSGLQATTSITVGDRAQFISLGTGNTIEIVGEDTAYLKRFTAFVTDAESNPVQNVTLTVSGTPVKYTELLDPSAEPGDPNYNEIRPAFYKGYWSPFPATDDFDFWVPVRTIGCPNEDIDGDSIADQGEDVNGDGELTPGNVVAITDSVVTDENGQALIEVRYPKTFAAWVTIRITVSTPVGGSESQASQLFELGAASSDLALESTPPNANPFGRGTQQVEDPDNPGTFITDDTNLVCTNTL